MWILKEKLSVKFVIQLFANQNWFLVQSQAKLVTVRQWYWNPSIYLSNIVSSAISSIQDHNICSKLKEIVKSLSLSHALQYLVYPLQIHTHTIPISPTSKGVRLCFEIVRRVPPALDWVLQQKSLFSSTEFDSEKKTRTKIIEFLPFNRERPLPGRHTHTHTYARFTSEQVITTKEFNVLQDRGGRV